MRRGAQGFFLFLTPKHQKIAKPKKLAFLFGGPYLAFVALRSWSLAFGFCFGSYSFRFLTPFYEVLTKNEKARWTLRLACKLKFLKL
jgi:hypothetical protein